MVDDGSPDKCPLICDDWAKKDSRIIVLHKENGGLSDARNKGLDIATGDYISFVDSDDWIASNFYEVMMFALKKEQAQIAASGITWAYDDHYEEDLNQYSKKVYSADEAIDSLIQGKGFYAVAWNKLYCRSLFETIRFPVGKLHEDEFIIYKVMGQTKKLVLCVETKYFYQQRSDSIMQQWSIKRLDALDAFAERNNYLKNNFPKLYLKDKISLFIICLYFYRECEKMSNVSEGREKILTYAQNIHFTIKELINQKPKILLKLIIGMCFFKCIKIKEFFYLK